MNFSVLEEVGKEMERTLDPKPDTQAEDGLRRRRPKTVQEEPDPAEGPEQPASEKKLRLRGTESATVSGMEKSLAGTELMADSERLIEELVKIQNKAKAQRELKKALKKKTEETSAIERLENAAKRYLEAHDEETALDEETKKLFLEAKKALEEAKMYWEKNKKSASEKVLEQPSVPEPPSSAKAAQPASAKEPSSEYLESPGDRAGKDEQPVSVDGVGEEEM